MNKYNNNKTRCTKNKHQLTAKEVAEIASCSERYVKKLRAGLVNDQSPLAQRVKSVDAIAQDGKSLLLQEIERIVKLP